MITEITETVAVKPSKRKYDKVAERINKTLEVNIFENKRDLITVDARATACYIFRKYYGGTLHGIADYFKSKGKNLDHSTVYYNVNLYERDIKKRREDIRSNFTYFLGSIDKTTNLNIVLDTILDDADKQRIIEIVKRLVRKYENKNVI